MRECPILYSLLPVSSWPSSPWHTKITSPCTTCFLFLLPRSTAQLQVHQVEVNPSPNLFCWQNFSPKLKNRAYNWNPLKITIHWMCYTECFSCKVTINFCSLIEHSSCIQEANKECALVTLKIMYHIVNIRFSL